MYGVNYFWPARQSEPPHSVRRQRKRLPADGFIESAPEIVPPGKIVESLGRVQISKQA